MIRAATVQDVPLLADLGPDYLREAKAGGTYSREATERSLNAMLADPGYRIVVEDIDGALAGAAIFALDSAWTVEPWLYIQSFYVAPWARGAGVGRALMAEAVRVAEASGAAGTFAIAGAGKLFANLAAKFGFAPCGEIYMRNRNA